MFAAYIWEQATVELSFVGVSQYFTLKFSIKDFLIYSRNH